MLRDHHTWALNWLLCCLFFRHSVVSDSWRLHGLQHARLPCPSRCPRVCSNSCPLNRWFYPTILPSVTLFSSCPQCFQVSGAFPMESTFCIRWPKYWRFSFSISPSSENSGLISSRIGWFDLLAIQETLKSLLQNHSLKASIILIIQCSAFFMVQLSHPYMTTGKTIALTRRIFAGKVMSLLFNTLSSLVIAFLPRNKIF